MCVTFRCEISEIKQFKVHVITTIMNQTHYVRIIVYLCQAFKYITRNNKYTILSNAYISRSKMHYY